MPLKSENQCYFALAFSASLHFFNKKGVEIGLILKRIPSQNLSRLRNLKRNAISVSFSASIQFFWYKKGVEISLIFKRIFSQTLSRLRNLRINAISVSFTGEIMMSLNLKMNVIFRLTFRPSLEIFSYTKGSRKASIWFIFKRISCQKLSCLRHLKINAISV